MPLNIATLNNLLIKRLAQMCECVFERGFHADMPINNVKQHRMKGYILHPFITSALPRHDIIFLSRETLGAL